MILTTSETPVPHVQVTVDGAATSGTTVRVWREWGGQRAVVRGADSLVVLGSDVIEDWEAPLGVPVTYRVEVLAGPDLTGTVAATVTLESASGWLSDPLDPTMGVPVSCGHDSDGKTVLTAQALSQWAWPDLGGVMHVMGDRIPVGYGPGAGGPTDVPLNVFTDTAEDTTRLANLLDSSAAQFCLRALPHWWPLPPLGYWRISRALMPVNAFVGGTIWEWELTGTQVRPQTLKVAVPLWTYDEVQTVWETLTYDQVQASADALALTYTDVKRDPEAVQ